MVSLTRRSTSRCFPSLLRRRFPPGGTFSLLTVLFWNPDSLKNQIPGKPDFQKKQISGKPEPWFSQKKNRSQTRFSKNKLLGKPDHESDFKKPAPSGFFFLESTALWGPVKRLHERGDEALLLPERIQTQAGLRDDLQGSWGGHPFEETGQRRLRHLLDFIALCLNLCFLINLKSFLDSKLLSERFQKAVCLSRQTVLLSTALSFPSFSNFVGSPRRKTKRQKETNND